MNSPTWLDYVVLVVLLASDVLLWQVWRHASKPLELPQRWSLTYRCAACGGEAGQDSVVVDDTFTALLDAEPIRTRYYLCQQCLTVARAEHPPSPVPSVPSVPSVPEALE